MVPLSGAGVMVVSGALLTAHCSLLTAQSWNEPAALALVQRAVERRQEARADSALRGWRTRAHGFVFFLAQIGEGLTGPPRLVKADELDVEVYWQAPGLSKQIVLGWRDSTFLPTDINYHRDHLGIVTNEFGDVIRIGEGDEVRDVPHPLSPAGLAEYEFALGDSLAIRGALGEVRVREVRVRPRSFARPLVVGSLYLDAATARVVRFRFSFTPAAYLDRQVEDISIVLENSLIDGRFWLPYRQEIEIRRRASWLDFPARGIIRGRWEIGDFELGLRIPPAVLAGPEIGGLVRPQPADSGWDRPLREALAGAAPPLDRRDMQALRTEIERTAGARLLSGLPGQRVASGSLSDLAHINRVQGLTLGLGATFRLGASRARLRPRLAFGTGDERLTGELAFEAGLGAAELTAFASRRVRDLGDLPVISPLLNSLLAQEAGDDYGDYVLLDAAGLRLRRPLGSGVSGWLEVALERSRSVEVAATPARGSYRANPPLGSGTYRMARLRLERETGRVAWHRGVAGGITIEVGEGPADYLRVSGAAAWLLPLGRTRLRVGADAGIGTSGLPPHRSFVLGGRGTLVGEPFRAYGGREFVLGRLEWRAEVPVPAIPLGSFASTGPTLVVAPFVAAGWAGRPLPGLPWVATDGVRPVAGVALEWFQRLIRLEAGIGLRDGEAGVTVDVHPDWWGIL
ncbi:MAG TPA: hypothetical protein VFU46_12740 [Gemmatimonadales bacterium]|nr:hypothetical protein [Gemmatimonadales bacterium]